MALKVYLEEAGCDRRRLDAATIRNYLEANGYSLVGDPSSADRILAITCAFKQDEEDESIRRLRSLRKYGRDIVVYGCLADIASDRYTEFTDLPSVSPREIETIDRHFETHGVAFSDVPQANIIERRDSDLMRFRRSIESGTVPLRKSLSRAVALMRPRPKVAFTTRNDGFNLFICRGCLGSCSYCAIRRAIGTVQSKPAEDVVAELIGGLDAGFRTLSILGDDPGCYGADLSSSLPELLDALFTASDSWSSGAADRVLPTEPIRFHIREIHPKHLVEHHQAVLELPGVSHLGGILCPVQSGSDRILDLMQRSHTASELLQAIRRIKARRPETELSTQIIVGFPSETEDDLARTLEYVSDAGFSSVVVFPYDDKQDTVSSGLPGKIAPREIERRMHTALRYFRTHGVPAYRSCP